MTNAAYGKWNESEGDTAAPRGPAWTLQQAHDSIEDAILEKVDAERGWLPERRMSAEGQGMRGVLVVVQADDYLRRALEKFVDRLVAIMIHAPADGGGSATRAYVIAREMQLLFRADERYEAHVSPEGARALATELDNFLPNLGWREGEVEDDWMSRTAALRPLGELRDAVADALSTRTKTRRHNIAAKTRKGSSGPEAKRKGGRA
jgi:hypothetical protein